MTKVVFDDGMTLLVRCAPAAEDAVWRRLLAAGVGRS